MEPQGSQRSGGQRLLAQPGEAVQEEMASIRSRAVAIFLNSVVLPNPEAAAEVTAPFPMPEHCDRRIADRWYT